MDDGATPAVEWDGGGDATTSATFFISEVRPKESHGAASEGEDSVRLVLIND